MLIVFHSKVHLKDLWRLLASASSNANGVVPEAQLGPLSQDDGLPLFISRGYTSRLKYLARRSQRERS